MRNIPGEAEVESPAPADGAAPQGSPAPGPPPRADAGGREARLAAALRANLRRRKAPSADG